MNQNHNKSILLLCLMFLLVGAMFTMNDILLPVVMEFFDISYTQATLIQVSFYIPYILFPIPIAILILKYGYKVSLIVSLFLCAFGCLLFYPAQLLNSYITVLSGIFILSTGIAVINVAAIPLISFLGDVKGSHSRINFVQSFSRIGYAVTPVIATSFIFKNAEEEAIKFYLPYMVLFVLLILIAIVFWFSKIPAMKSEDSTFNIKEVIKEAREYPHLIFGIVAMFFYVGAEACTAGFFIPYLTSQYGFTVSEASGYLTLYYVFSAIMGIIAAVWLLRFIKARILVGGLGLFMVLIFIICIYFDTGYNEYLMASLGIGLSVMFPTIFSLAIEDLQDFSAKGSALLNFAIVGGAVFTPIQGLLADLYSVAFSYYVPLICFLVVTMYAFFFTKGAIYYLKKEKVHDYERAV